MIFRLWIELPDEVPFLSEELSIFFSMPPGSTMTSFLLSTRFGTNGLCLLDNRLSFLDHHPQRVILSAIQHLHNRPLDSGLWTRDSLDSFGLGILWTLTSGLFG